MLYNTSITSSVSTAISEVENGCYVGNGHMGNGGVGNGEVGNGYVGNGHVDPNRATMRDITTLRAARYTPVNILPTGSHAYVLQTALST